MSVSVSERKYYEEDDPKAIEYLKEGRAALTVHDYSAAMRYFKKSYKNRVSKPLAILLLIQMANCMDELGYYDQQQTFLEDLCELELNFTNVRRLMKIYLDTNNDAKMTAFSKKIKELTAGNEDEEKLAMTLLAQAKDYDEVIARSLEWLEKHPDDLDVSRAAINTYLEQKKVEDAAKFAESLVERGMEDKLCVELSRLRGDMFDFEGCRDYMLKHFDLHKENTYGVNMLAHSLMTNASYNGTLTPDQYEYWGGRAREGTRPQTALNTDFDIDTGFFRKIRVGFVSYDFRAHSVGKFIMSLFDAIPGNTGIETYCYYTYPDHKDDFTAVIQDKADVFKFVGRYSNKELRKELLGDRLDILVDLNGQTAGTKLPLLAERFAPVQITWMGFPFSSFYFNIDYIIGDYYFDSDDGMTEKYCTEKVLRMDPCYMCFALNQPYAIDPEPPQVRNGYVTFGMMNNPKKYSAEAIALWQKCLDAVPGSRLLLQLSAAQGDFVEGKFKERLAKYGLDLSRVDLGRDYGNLGYFGTYNKCDVMLDSFPFGGGTTTPEAIWMGVPVIGCQYLMRHGRMAYSFMSNIGLGHLCADSVEAYPEKAREVATDVALLRSLRGTLRDRLKQTPLYDTEIFRRAFDDAIRDVFITHCESNKKPFSVKRYEGQDGELLRDCSRASDVVMREITRERGADSKREEALLAEYTLLHEALLERLSDIYADDAGALQLAVKLAQLVEMLGSAQDAVGRGVIVKSVKTLVQKFA